MTPAASIYELLLFQEKIDDLMDKMNVPVVEGKAGENSK